jgi:D-3-phosphoglycerate dehydrogenase
MSCSPRMVKVLLVTEKPFATSAISGIESELNRPTTMNKYTLEKFEKYTSNTELLTELEKVKPDAVIIRSDLANKEFFSAAGTDLKIVVRAGAGVDNIDLNAATEAGIVAMNTPGQNSNAVAELVFGMMVFHVRGKFSGDSGSELRGKTIAVYGCGNVGRFVVKIAKGFGMHVIALDPYMSDDQIRETGAEPVHEVSELFGANFVTLHIPATPETKESINRGLLDLMPKGGVVINTARFEVMHEADLAAWLKDRSDCGYLADVTPLNLDTLKAQLGTERFAKQVFVTPKKLGAQTVEANNNAGPAAARQIVDFFEKGDVRFQVNKPGKTF